MAAQEQEYSFLPFIPTDEELVAAQNDLIMLISTCQSIANNAFAEIIVLCGTCEDEHVTTTDGTSVRESRFVHGAFIHARNFKRLTNGGLGVDCPNGHTVEPPLTDVAWWTIERYLGQLADAKTQHPSATPDVVTTIDAPLLNNIADSVSAKVA